MMCFKYITVHVVQVVVVEVVVIIIAEEERENFFTTDDCNILFHDLTKHLLVLM